MIKRLSCVFILLCLSVCFFVSCNDAVKSENFSFAVSIEDEATVTDNSYSFTAFASLGDAKARLEVTCNGILIEEKDGKYNASLHIGDNEIEIIAYADNKSETRTYKIICKREFKIDTNIQEAKIKDDSVVFYARAVFNDSPCQMQVMHNGEAVAVGQSGYYTVTLDQGLNTFLITARQGDYYEEKEWVINYDGFVLSTNISSHDTNKQNYEFRALSQYGDEVCSVVVKSNDTIVAPDGNKYSVTLTDGENNIDIIVSYDGIEKTYTYTVRYFDTPPVMSTSIKDGSTYLGSTFNFDLTARDGLGTKISAQNVSFSADWDLTDGADQFVPTDDVSVVWDDSTMTSFRILFNRGDFASHKNTEFALKVTVSDDFGRTVSEIYKMTYTPAAYGEKIGEVVFSLEGFSINCGYFIEPMYVPIYEGIPFSVTLTELLDEKGLEYEYTGSTLNNFYLASIWGLDLSGNSIADGIWDKVKDRGYTRTIELGSSLGEFDYGSGTGWMYSVNGVYKNYGFADYYPQDGEAVRVQFTVMLGEDLGGGGALGEGSGGGWLGDNPDYAPVMKYLADIGKTDFDKTVYDEVISVISKWNLSQKDMDMQFSKLKAAYGEIR